MSGRYKGVGWCLGSMGGWGGLLAGDELYLPINWIAVLVPLGTVFANLVTCHHPCW